MCGSSFCLLAPFFCFFQPVSADAQPDKSPDRIAGMFDAIAGRYDLLNTVLSAVSIATGGASRLRSLALTGRETLLDVCTGTADVAIGAARRSSGARRVVGVDFAGAMLAHGLDKVRVTRRSTIGFSSCAATRCGCRSPTRRSTR